MKSPPDLERLAQEGELKRKKAQEVEALLAELKRDMNMRVALGAHYGSTRQRVFFVLIALGVLVMVAPATGLIAEPVPAWHGALAFGLGLVGVLGAAILEPVASKARIAAEERYIKEQPFPVDGYFDVLKNTPQPTTRLQIEVHFRGAPPEQELFQNLVARTDSSASVHMTGSTGIIVSAPISGATGVRVNNQFVYRNHRIVPYVHRLLDEVLAKVHGAHPIAMVRITPSWM